MPEMPEALREVMNLQRGQSRARPEGPFESGDAPRASGISGEDLALFLDFVDALGDEADQVLSLNAAMTKPA